MECSLVDFLRTGRLADLCIGLARTKVFEFLGEPTGCIDDHPKAPRDRCAIWLHGPLQLNFSTANQIEDIRLCCRIYESEEKILRESYSPLQFTDLEPSSVGTLEDFLALLGSEGIPFSQEAGRGKRLCIRTSPGVVAAFGRRIL